MAHSNKPQPESYGPYQAECEAAAELSEEGRYWEEVSYLETARRDQFDGFDRGDLDYPWGADEWGEDAESGAVEPLLPPSPSPSSLPVSIADEDDIRF